MGEIAALGTAIFWAFTSVFFTSAGKQVGSVIVNRVRLVLAVAILSLTHLALTGQLVPLGAEPYRWFWLGLSGIVGLALGDTFLFQCYVLIGNRLGTLLMASAPVISVIGAWIFLGEMLGVYDILGISVCLFGIAMVVLEKRNGNGNHTPHTRRQYTIGILFGFAAATCQAAGLILAKKGLDHDFPPLSATLMRMLVALTVIWLITLGMGKAKFTIQQAIQNPLALRAIIGGVIFGPFLGVWLSLIAVQHAPVGIASTLMALSPVVVLPIAKWGFKEHVSARTAIWTLVALVGAGIIFLA
ncbi:MAG: DMT family transporter [Chloroflexota bacterium]